MAQIKTSLSAGETIRPLLLGNEEIAQRVTKIFPIYTPEAVLPYIVYRRAALESTSTKGGYPSAEWIHMEIYCYSEFYDESVELSELVRYCIESGSQGYLIDSEEGYESDAFAQKLVFKLKI